MTPTSHASLTIWALFTGAHRFADAEPAYKEAADIRRELAAQNQAFRPDLAETLYNLGYLYDHTGRSAETEAAYRRPPKFSTSCAQSPVAYGPISQTLTNLANFYSARQRLADAEGTQGGS